MDFSNINYLAVLVGGVAAFVLGSLWYTALFGKAWQAIIKIDEEKAKKSMFKTMFLSFLLMTVMAFGLALLIQGHSENSIDWLSGLYHGTAMGILFSGASLGINYLYQQKPFKLWLIDAFYGILFLSMQGAILGAWPK